MLLPPGNASYTHGYPQLRFRSLDKQKFCGIIGETISSPAVDAVIGTPLNYTMDDVKVETVCLRVGGASTGKGGSSGNKGDGSDGEGENGAPSPDRWRDCHGSGERVNSMASILKAL